jgi:aminomethyltransferase
MIDDGTVFRLGDNNFRWIGGNDLSGLWLREQAEKRGLDVWVKTSTDQLANIAVQGPKSREILEGILWTSPTWQTMGELGWFRFSVARLHDFHGMALVVSRTGYTGELGYELSCHPKDARTLFEAVMQAGESYGITPFGLGALDMVRIEAGLVFAGCEFDDRTDPFEAGIGFTVPLRTKTDDFIGRDALERRKAHPSRKLVGLDLEGKLVPSTGDCVRVGRAQIGEITSAVRSPILGRVIALCRMDVTHATLGDEVEVGQLDGHQKRIPARIVAFPHFDPEKRRVRGDYG